MKEHGFNLELSRLHASERLSRLTLVVCILYVWLVTTGEFVLKHGLQTEVDRTDRQDLSIFRIGWDWLERRFALDNPSLFYSDLTSLWCRVASMYIDSIFQLSEGCA